MYRICTFSERLRDALKYRNMSAAELSRKAGISEGVISQYKSGLYEPKDDRADILARILHVSVVWLFGYDVPMDTELSKEDAALLTLRGLDDTAAKMSERLKTLRNQSYLTLDSASKALHVPVDDLENWENGKQLDTISNSDFQNMRNIYKTNMDHLVYGKSDPSFQAENISASMEKLGITIKLKGIVSRLSVGQHRFVYETVEGFRAISASDDQDSFYIRQMDDSMVPLIRKYDLALVHYQKVFRSGDCIAILMDSLNPQIRLFQKGSNYRMYIPMNGSGFETITIHNEEKDPVIRLGKIISVLSETRIGEPDIIRAT